MPLPIPLTTRPMEAEPVDNLPRGKGWLYEPKYDGFRCLAFRDGDRVDLQSKNQKPLGRFFPEIAAGLARLKADSFVLDGEIIIPGHSFETLQLRLHPAASRVARLAKEYPARLIVFDLLADGTGRLTGKPLSERRAALKGFVKAAGKNPVLALSKATSSAATAIRWLSQPASTASWPSRSTNPIVPASASCASTRSGTPSTPCSPDTTRTRRRDTIDSLLFGLYGEDGLLHFVGHSRVYDDAAEIARLLEPLKGGTGFTGRSPGGKSRWTGKAQKLVRLDPVLVAELSADHISGGQFRHGSRLIRWRTDKAPQDCTMDQIALA